MTDQKNNTINIGNNTQGMVIGDHANVNQHFATNIHLSDDPRVKILDERKRHKESEYAQLQQQLKQAQVDERIQRSVKQTQDPETIVKNLLPIIAILVLSATAASIHPIIGLFCATGLIAAYIKYRPTSVTGLVDTPSRVEVVQSKMRNIETEIAQIGADIHAIYQEHVSHL